jgi:RsiW-degrading membrane proteinase PrsW (M82 family)
MHRKTVNRLHRHTGIVFAGALAVLFGVAGATAVRASCQTSVTGFFVGAAGALPSLVAPLLYARWLDRRPGTEQLLLLAWGGLCATVLARTVNNAVGGEAGVLVAAPVAEEVLKAAPLVALALWRWATVTVPAMVARGVVVAAGFAAVETVFLVAEEYAYGTGGALRVALVRAAAGPLTHPLFTGIAAIGVALACTARRPATRILVPVLGFTAAIGLHATWNLVTTRLAGATTVLFGATAAVLVLTLAYLARTRRPKNY